MKWIYITLLLPLLTLPAYAQDSEGLIRCGNSNDPNDICTYSDLVETIDRVVQAALLYIAIPAAVIIIIVGGFNILTSGGDEGKVKTGRTMIQAAAIGLAMAFGAWLIVETVLSILF